MTAVTRSNLSGTLQDGTLYLDLHADPGPVSYEEILELFYEALGSGTGFVFLSCPAILIRDGKTFHIPEDRRQSQARRAGLSFPPLDPGYARDFMDRVSRSRFRSSFHLKGKELEYARNRSLAVLARHAWDFEQTRLVPAHPARDGKQTAMKGHPVFLAAHATGTCCRGCLEKWHRIPRGMELDRSMQIYIVQIQMLWIRNELERNPV